MQNPNQKTQSDLSQKKPLKPNGPLAYSPPYLGSKNVSMSPLVVLGAFIKDPNIWQVSVDSDLDGNIQLNFRGSLIEHLYKESQVLLPNGVIAPQNQYYQVYASLSTSGGGANSGEEPIYCFNLWLVDNKGSIVEEYQLPLAPLLSLLYPEAKKFHLNWSRYLEIDHPEESRYNWCLRL